jgi:peptidoglycan hydrolase-like protein with peptidoglycan-binding domain
VLINGLYDNLTEQSVKAIQKMFDLTVNGVVGASTWVKIVGLANELKS